MKKIYKWLVLGLTIAFVGQAIAQNYYPFLTTTGSPFTDLSFLGAGARAHAMGGAFYAISDDPSAISWNPAGLTQMDKYQMSASFHHTRSQNKYDGTYVPSSPRAAFSGDIAQSFDQLAYAGVVIPFELKGRKFVGSAAVPISVLEIRGRDFRDSMGMTQELNGRLSMGSIGLATKVWKDLSLGLALNIYGGSCDRNALEVSQFSLPPDDTVRVYHPRIISSFSGWNFTLGSMLKLEKLRLAAVFKAPFTEKSPLKEDLDEQLVTDKIIRGVTNPSGFAEGVLLKTKREWILPSIVGFGASYQMTDNLLVSADYDIKPMSQAWVRVQVDSTVPNSDFEPRQLKWTDINQFRIGAEYILRAQRYAIPVRAGYRNDSKPYENVDNSYAFLSDLSNGGTGIYYSGLGSQVKGHVVSFGTGVAFGQVGFDISWEFGRYDFNENGVLQSNIDPATGTYTLVPFSRKSEVSDNRVIFNFTGVF